MTDEKEIIEELKELRRENIQSQKSGVYWEDNIKKEKDLESKIFELRYSRLNNEYILTHKWINTHTHTAQKWDILNYKNTACKVLELGTTSFNEAGDTFNYAARLKSLFTEEELLIEFGYYDTIDMLVNE